MRIVSGTHKGRIFDPPLFFKDRPTTDLAKESLFNILNNIIEYDDISVLDLFAGTGSISYEFASRGCNSVTCIEKNFKYISYIKKNIELFQFPHIKPINGDVFRLLEKINGEFDIIFADPPYTLNNIITIPSIVFERKLLTKNGLLIIEHSKDIDFQVFNEFQQIRNYGKVNFSFLSYLPENFSTEQ